MNGQRWSLDTKVRKLGIQIEKEVILAFLQQYRVNIFNFHPFQFSRQEWSVAVAPLIFNKKKESTLVEFFVVG